MNSPYATATEIRPRPLIREIDEGQALEALDVIERVMAPHTKDPTHMPRDVVLSIYCRLSALMYKVHVAMVLEDPVAFVLTDEQQAAVRRC